MKDLNHYSRLSEMFRYPSHDQEKLMEEWQRIVKPYGTELLTKLDNLRVHIQTKNLTERQEYFTHTFDVQPLCFLDIGYIIFGEDYRRGIFLSNMKKEQEMAGNQWGKELPDHLPEMLTLLPKLKDPAMAEELIWSVMIPALHEMVSMFGSNGNIYKGLLEILVAIMETDYPSSEFERFNIVREKSDFVKDT